MSDPAIGYHASHEQFDPGQLLDLVVSAEAAGFEAVLASDHFHPWSERQGESGHVWSWLGAAMNVSSLDFASVTAPGYRYHPAVLAQAVGTLHSMYGDRFDLCIGSGQLLNEGITGERWPVKADRNARLEECADVMRRLWRGEQVTHRERITVEEATLYTRPEASPPLIGAALSTETAAWLADWADGMITLATPDQEADRERIEAFRAEAAEKPVYLKAQLSYAENEDNAIQGAYDQWRTNCIPGVATQQLRTPTDYEALGELIDPETVREHVRVSSDLDRHVDWIEQDMAVDVDGIYLHNVHPDQASFIEDFGRDVLPSVA